MNKSNNDEKIVNLNEDSKQHEHNSEEFEKLAKRQQELKKSK